MEAISLTDFVDFVTKVGSPKLTQVRTVKNRGDYDPATDFWKALREGIVAFHEGGDGDKSTLDLIVSGLKDKKKVSRYQECVKGYKKFLGRKHIEWHKPKMAIWSPGSIDIRVNPEVGLKINGVSHVLKLHLKSGQIAKRRVDAILLLMQQALNAKKGVQYGVLDVPRAKLYASDAPDLALLPLLVGEAAAFRAIWDEL